MSIVRRVVIALLVGSAAVAPQFHALPAQEAPTVRFTSRAAEVSVGGRVQTLFSTTTADGSIPALWELRRARLELAVRANSVISARLQPEFSGSQVGLRDAYVAFTLAPATQLLVGNAFRPFSLIAQTSSVLVLPVERGARIRGVSPAALEHYALVQGLGYADRDIGVQLRTSPAGAPLGLNLGIGLFNGPAQAAAGEELSYQLAGRASIAPVPGLRIGAGWSRRDFASPAQPVELRTGTAWEVDVELGGHAPGLHLVGEAVVGDLDPFAGAGRQPARFRAGQLWLAYRTLPTGGAISNIEPTFRLSHGDTRAGNGPFPEPGGTLFTPGINFYFGPLNRIMINYDVWRPRADGEAEGSFKTMFQIAF